MPMNLENQGQVAVITGYGAITSIGSGAEMVWSALDRYRQEECHPDCRSGSIDHCGFVDFDTSSHIKKHSNLRGMSNSQVASTCAAGMALDKAGLKNEAGLLETIPTIITCNGHHREYEVDDNIVRDLAWNDAPAPLREETLNKLLRKVRPTLFLTQLPNLFTANIAMNLGVAGECVTILGEEEAGINAIELAYRRIASGQNDIVLVGGAFDGSDKYLKMVYVYSGLLQRNRNFISDSSFSLGSAASFIVLESKNHAQARGADMYGQVSAVEQNIRVSSSSASPSGSTASLQTLLKGIERRLKKPSLGVLLISAGEENIEEEVNLWKSVGGQDIGPYMRSASGMLGYLREASCATYINIAISCLQKKRMYRGVHFDSHLGLSVDSSRKIDQVAISIVGRHSGEAIVLLDVAKAEEEND